MIQLVSLMWATAIFFAILGLQRGWAREIISTTGIMMAIYLLFQIDTILRTISVSLSASSTQLLFFQLFILGVISFIAYWFKPSPRVTSSWQSSLLGGLIGFVNGYLIGGTVWYLMDINEYPLAPYVLAPGPNSVSAQSIGYIPIIFLNGGISGNGELIIIAMLGLFFVAAIAAL